MDSKLWFCCLKSHSLENLRKGSKIVLGYILLNGTQVFPNLSAAGFGKWLVVGKLKLWLEPGLHFSYHLRL